MNMSEYNDLNDKIQDINIEIDELKEADNLNLLQLNEYKKVVAREVENLYGMITYLRNKMEAIETIILKKKVIK
jgi:hypothetical protein